MIQFRNHIIKRTYEGRFKGYRKYKPFLAKDFSHRCGYCNMKDDTMTTYFEVDHYIPSKSFKDKRDDLLCDYDNLIYSCRKCNLAKSSIFQGNIFDNPLINELIYDPASVDFNTIFYRNKFGGISSNDVLGKKMIISLKLYLPIHNLSWICEELDEVLEILDEKIDSSNYPTEVKQELEQARFLLSNEYRKWSRMFIRNYNKM